jgi:hypothetical protein
MENSQRKILIVLNPFWLAGFGFLCIPQAKVQTAGSHLLCKPQDHCDAHHYCWNLPSWCCLSESLSFHPARDSWSEEVDELCTEPLNLLFHIEKSFFG